MGEWVKTVADKRNDANYEIVDIAAFKLPLLGEVDATEQATAWNTKLASLDASYLSFKSTTTAYQHH